MIHLGSILRNQVRANLLLAHAWLIKGAAGHSLGESPKYVPAKVGVIALYSLDTITEVTGEPLNFSTVKTQLMKTQQQGMIKRIECLSHMCIQKYSRNTFPQRDSLVNNSKPRHGTFSSA